MLLYVCKQTFHISHVRISPNVNVKSPTYYFHVMAIIFTDFQICISVPLRAFLKYECETVGSFDTQFSL